MKMDLMMFLQFYQSRTSDRLISKLHFTVWCKKSVDAKRGKRRDDHAMHARYSPRF